MKLGMIDRTRMPSFAHSPSSASVRPRTANLVAE